MTAPTLRAELIRAVDDVEHVVVDVSGVSFIDSSGLATLLAVHKRARAGGRRLEFRHPSRSFRTVVEIAGLAETLGIDAE